MQYPTHATTHVDERRSRLEMGSSVGFTAGQVSVRMEFLGQYLHV